MSLGGLVFVLVCVAGFLLAVAFVLAVFVTGLRRPPEPTLARELGVSGIYALSGTFLILIGGATTLKLLRVRHLDLPAGAGALLGPLRPLAVLGAVWLCVFLGMLAFRLGRAAPSDDATVDPTPPDPQHRASGGG